MCGNSTLGVNLDAHSESQFNLFPAFCILKATWNGIFDGSVILRMAFSPANYTAPTLTPTLNKFKFNLEHFLVSAVQSE